MIEMNSQAMPLVDETSAAFLGQWNRLVSSTNWEKGRIIHDWRGALLAAESSAAEYSDEEWSRRAGGITGQHVGRLRRVHERFATTREQFTALFWSHFQAALDWTDAEMWLEGAGQNDWSVAEMRRRRAETLGLLEAGEPLPGSSNDAFADEIDSGDEAESSGMATATDFDDRGDRAAADDRRTAADSKSSTRNSDRDNAPFDTAEDDDNAVDRKRAEPRRPFAHLAELPDDLSEAFEAFKLGIVRHKLTDWRDVARDDVLAALDALRDLATMPIE